MSTEGSSSLRSPTRQEHPPSSADGALPGTSTQREGKVSGKGKAPVDNENTTYAPVEPTRLNRPGIGRYGILRQLISPDPSLYKGLKDPITGERFYYRAMTDQKEMTDAARETMAKHAVDVPRTFLVAGSHNQLGSHGGRSPRDWQEVQYTGVFNMSKKPVWIRMTPKLWGWTDEELQQRLLAQHRNFLNHNSGQIDSEWAKIDHDIRRHCNLKICITERPEDWTIVRSQKEEPLSPQGRRFDAGSSH